MRGTPMSRERTRPHCHTDEMFLPTHPSTPLHKVCIVRAVASIKRINPEIFYSLFTCTPAHTRNANVSLGTHFVHIIITHYSWNISGRLPSMGQSTSNDFFNTDCLACEDS